MAKIQQWKASEPWLKIECKLGEHPFYEPYSNTLRFVDIVKKDLHTVDLSKGPESLRTVSLNNSVGCTADVDGEEGKTMIVGAKYGYAYMSHSTGTLEYITKPEQLWNAADEDAAAKSERMRFNDGNIDPQGRFWAGMMNDPLVKEPTSEGALFVLSRDGRVRRAIDKATIPNGIGWSADGTIMWFIDSPTKTIWVYDFDGSTGEISNKRAWWSVGDDESDEVVPDGFCQDTDGCIWLALHAGGKVIKLRDDGSGRGVKIGEVLLPTRYPTCPRLVNGDLYVTSAEEQEPNKNPNSDKQAGSVFKVAVGASPIPMNKWTR